MANIIAYPNDFGYKDSIAYHKGQNICLFAKRKFPHD
jgi:hypothetical protein